MSRCYKPEHRNYKRYGARGIAVAKPWHKFSQFFSDMQAHFAPGLWLDRIDNAQGYSLGNCRWVTPTESQNNKTNNRLVTSASGETKTVAMWARHVGAHRNLILDRLNRGWPEDEAIFTPPARRLLTIDGITKCLNEWARASGVESGTLWARLDRGWPPKKAVSTPVRPMRRKKG